MHSQQPSGEAPAVRAVEVVKRFGSTTALDRLSLTVPRGALYALLGPNGAGKSTTLSLLCGVLSPDAGRLEVLGREFSQDALSLRARIGVVPEDLALVERLSGAQFLTFCGRLYGLPGAVAAQRCEELLAVTALADKASAQVETYSKGMRRRLALAAALIHAPELLLLDEPFEGVDVVASSVLRELLAALRQRGVTIVLTTHVLEIAERLATHAGILRSGRLVDEGSCAELRARHGGTLEALFHKLTATPAVGSTRLSFYDQGGT